MTPQPGSIISGTLLPRDLIPAFVVELERLDPHVASEFHASDLRSPETILDVLHDLLEEQAGDDLYFGAHPDDGTRFGFWPVRRERVPA